MSGPNRTLTFQHDLKVTECPCGSGKKPEKCCGPAKQRTYSVDMDPRNYYESDGFAIGLDSKLNRIVNGQLKPLIGTPRFYQSYKRSKNDKVLVKGDSAGEYVMSPESILLANDQLFVVDTNTRNLGSHRVSVTGVLHAYVEKRGEQHALMYGPATLLEFWDAEVSPELLGWYALLASLAEDDQYRCQRIGLIVDSELGKLDAMNDGRVPVLGDFYLPANCKLIYASADRGTSVANQLMRVCDRFASDKLALLAEDSQRDSLKETPYPCRWFRQWVH